MPTDRRPHRTRPRPDGCGRRGRHRGPPRTHEGAAGPGTNALSARVSQEIYLGSGRKLELALPDGTVLLAREQADRLSGVRRGDEVTVVWEVERGVLLDDTSGTTPPPTSGGRIPVAASAKESGR
ncbi:TOBE domain-containing protein [Streptomyces sp. DSM 41534]